MNKYCEIEKIYTVMEGFATKDEIDEEIMELTVNGYSFDDAIKILIANIDNWATFFLLDSDACIVSDRMKELKIKIELKYCTN